MQSERKPIRDTSQSGEGEIISRLISEYICEPFLVDVGAHDGVSISNSFPLVEAGWRAILIEPAPAVFSKLLETYRGRPDVTCLQLACSNSTGEADLYFGSDGEDGFLSTLCKDQNDWFSWARSQNFIRVKTETLTDILRRHNAPNVFGLLLVDTEGLDFEVLDGLDFSQFRPTIIVTEEYEWNTDKHAAKYSLLIKNGFSLVQKIGSNTIWIDRHGQKRTHSR
jgi:FkbM family methyltransferase